jgi:hypothetical protein
MEDDRLLENLQFGLYVAAGLIALWVSLRFLEAGAQGRAVLFFACCAAFVFVALEEISWGQRIYSFSSSKFFLFHNIQGETNVHNLTVFQPYLHGVYIVVAGMLTALSLVAGNRLRERVWFLIPGRRLVFYFLPVFAFYSWFEWNRLVKGIYIYPYDQELCEAVFALGAFLFMLQILIEQRDRAAEHRTV